MAYSAMPHGYRWQIDSALNNIVYHKKPWTQYSSVSCSECLDDVRVLNVSHSGIGDGLVQLMVWFDVEHHMIVPLDCELLL